MDGRLQPLLSALYRARGESATHVVAVRDERDGAPSFVPVFPGRSAREVAAEYGGFPYKVVSGVYDLREDLDEQVRLSRERRVLNFNDHDRVEYSVRPTAQPTRRTTMNYTTAAFLVNRGMRAVLAVYEEDLDGRSAPKRTMFKTLDPKVAKDDLVVVPSSTRHKATIVKVVEVDVSVDFDDPTPVAWIVARVDPAEHERLSKLEGEMVEILKKKEFEKRRAKVAADLGVGDDLKSLPLYANGDAP
jgi:bifunctional DNA-binding transcriptional regulator/antitoxin component of YhaV-PrlF toxin-antitoxin module